MSRRYRWRGYRQRGSKRNPCLPARRLSAAQRLTRRDRQQPFHCLVILRQLAGFTRMDRGAVNAAVNFAGHRGGQLTLRPRQTTRGIEYAFISKRALLKHRQVAPQQAEIVGVGMAESGEDRLLIGGIFCQRFGCQPWLPAQFQLGEYHRRGFAIFGERHGVPVACHDRGIAWHHRFVIEQTQADDQAALEADKRYQLRQCDNAFCAPAREDERIERTGRGFDRRKGQQTGKGQGGSQAH